MLSPTRVVLVALYLVLFSSACNADDLILELPDGKIQGRTLKNVNNTDYYAFQGIPYAAPPIGANRFKEPRDPDPWDGILDTTDNKKVCVQHPLWTISDVPVNQTEDCLYLNVFTPLKPGSGELLPVLVWIHGGGFMGGSGTFYSTGPKWFMDYGIVVVSLNYRLGPLGFLTTMDGVIPGNIGLKDQRQALRWVNKNIKLFGGDPDKVTIAGESAGGFSVGFQLLSLNSDGLFRGTIQESGTSMCRTAFTSDGRRFAFQLGNLFDKTLTEQNSTTDLLNVLQQFPAEDIISAGANVTDPEYSSEGYLSSLVWTAVLEDSIGVTDPFITAPMYQSFLDGNFHQVPTLLGYNSEEAIVFSGGSECYFGKSYDDNPALMVSNKLHFPSEDRDTIGEELKKIYTNTSFENDLAACYKYSTDATFLNPIVRQAEVTSQYVPVYLYQFSYAGELGAPKGRLVIPGTERVGHAEDLKYLWEFGYSGEISPEDLITVDRLHQLWTNFVKFLNPTPEEDNLLDRVIWNKVVAGENIEYLNINNTLEMRSNPRYYQKVKALFQKYEQNPRIVW